MFVGIFLCLEKKIKKVSKKKKGDDTLGCLIKKTLSKKLLWERLNFY